MCGIVGYVGSENATPILIEGLKRLEYRGYDSAGVAVLTNGKIEIRRSEGKLINLQKAIEAAPVSGTAGIGHTRWATHGRPTATNAHPHADCEGRIVVVHNGIIENYLELKKSLEKAGHRFDSETDTEVLAHLIEEHYADDLLTALLSALSRVEGAYAVGVISSDQPGRLLAARKSSPLIVGIEEDGYFIASDAPAILPYTRQVIYLDDEEVADLNPEKFAVVNLKGEARAKTIHRLEWNPVLAEKGGFDHFMLKEIFEQPQVIRNTIGGRTSEETGKIFLDDLGLKPEEIQSLKRVYIVACGTAYYAGCVGKYMLESLCDIPVETDFASEFRYREPRVGPDTLVVVVSQSGETADTLAALREAKRRGARVVGIVNVKGSSIAREVDGVLYIHAGPEIGVASTKAYTAMLTAFALLSLYFGQARGTVDEAKARDVIHRLKTMPQRIERVLENRAAIEAIAEKYHERRDFLYLGRACNFPTAMEGALKLKEISYIHAEAYAAGEMKHGPIALIDRHMPVVAIATKSATYEKILSNIQEVRSREGSVICLATEGDENIRSYCEDVIEVPESSELLSPIINVVPLQLLAYYVAVKRGSDVDQPRNLAKSVTVE